MWMFHHFLNVVVYCVSVDEHFRMPLWRRQKVVRWVYCCNFLNYVTDVPMAADFSKPICNRQLDFATLKQQATCIWQWHFDISTSLRIDTLISLHDHAYRRGTAERSSFQTVTALPVNHDDPLPASCYATTLTTHTVACAVQTVLTYVQSKPRSSTEIHQRSHQYRRCNSNTISLHSGITTNYCLPRLQSKFGQPVFLYSVPAAWNKLPMTFALIFSGCFLMITKNILF